MLWLNKSEICSLFRLGGSLALAILQPYGDIGRFIAAEANCRIKIDCASSRQMVDDN